MSIPLVIQPCMENLFQFTSKVQCKIQFLGERESACNLPYIVQDTHSCVFDAELCIFFHKISQGS